MYEAVSGLLEIFSAMFQGYCLQYFYGSFLESRIRNLCKTGSGHVCNRISIAVFYHEKLNQTMDRLEFPFKTGNTAVEKWQGVHPARDDEK